jgi:hypothetical protein
MVLTPCIKYESKPDLTAGLHLTAHLNPQDRTSTFHDIIINNFAATPSLVIQEKNLKRSFDGV